MAKNKVTIESGLKKDLQRYSVELCKALAHKVEDSLEEAHQIGMANFYTDYSPVVYHRHYYNFMDKVYKRYYKNPHNKTIRGGIEISPDYLYRIYTSNYKDENGNKITEDVTDLVFDLVYLQGRHGGFRFGAQIPTSIPPIQYVTERRRTIVNHIGLFSEDCFLKANEGAYTFISLS